MSEEIKDDLYSESEVSIRHSKSEGARQRNFDPYGISIKDHYSRLLKMSLGAINQDKDQPLVKEELKKTAGSNTANN